MAAPGVNGLIGVKIFFQEWLEDISCPNSLGSNPISLVFGKNVAYNASNWYFFQIFLKFQTTRIGLY
jgi:hypothetical protein